MPGREQDPGPPASLVRPSGRAAEASLTSALWPIGGAGGGGPGALGLRLV